MKTQPDFLWFECYRNRGDVKWSMGVMRDDFFGCRLAPDSRAEKDAVIPVDC